MDPQIENHHNQMPSEDQTSYQPYVPSELGAEPDPTQLRRPVVGASQSRKKLLIGLAVVGGIAILALTGYLASQAYHQPIKTADLQQTRVPAATPMVNPTLDAATSTLTGSALSESSLTSTDDSSAANDAGASANNVGDSINENNFQ